MDEIFEICDEVSVLRDGQLIMTKSTKETNMEELVSAMVGRSLSQRFPPVDNVPGEVIFEVKNLCTRYAPKLSDVSFSVKKGEILGFMALSAPEERNYWKRSSGSAPFVAAKSFTKENLSTSKGRATPSNTISLI